MINNVNTTNTNILRTIFKSRLGAPARRVVVDEPDTDEDDDNNLVSKPTTNTSKNTNHAKVKLQQ